MDVLIVYTFLEHVNDAIFQFKYSLCLFLTLLSLTYFIPVVENYSLATISVQ